LKKKTLILAANPENTPPIYLEESAHAITEELYHLSDELQGFQVFQQWAVRLNDIQQAILEYEPNFIHFLGYGKEKGIFLENEFGNLIEPEIIAKMFEPFVNQIECVIFDHCYVELQATKINDYIGHVIGINNELEKPIKIKFIIQFYHAINAGNTVREAFKNSQAAIRKDPFSSLLVLRVNDTIINRDEPERLGEAERFYQLGVNSFSHGLLEHAKNLLIKSVAFNPQHVNSLILLGKIYLEQRQFAKAIEFLTRAHQYDARTAQPSLVIALKSDAENSHDVFYKFEIYQRILQICPDDQETANLIKEQLALVKDRLQAIHGYAELEIEFLNREEDLILQDEIVLAFQIKNKGNAPANNFIMIIQAKDGACSIIGEDRFTKKYITPFSPADIIFHIKPHKMAFMLCLDYSYEDSTSQQYFYEQPIQLKKSNHEFIRIDNPYRSGNLTQYLESGDLSMFYGRQETLAKLREALIDNDERLMLIYGQRRTGKSCLLKYLEKSRCLEPDLHVVFINIQRVSSDAEMYRHILERVECLAASGEQIACQTFDEFVVMLDKLVAHLSKPMLLMLDEFEFVADAHFQYRMLANADDFLRKMRSFIQYQTKIKFVLAGADGLRAMIKDYRNPLFNAGRAFHIASLAPQEAHDLITRPLAETVDYSPQAALDIQRMTGNHPYYIQLLCQTIVALLNRKKFHAVTFTEVRQAIDELEKTGDGDLDYMWKITRKESHVILAILAEERGGNDWITRDRIQEVMTAEKIAITEDAIDEAIQELVEKDILLERPSQSEYIIPMGLLQRWILNHKPLKKTRREVA